MPRSINLLNLLTVFAHIAGTHDRCISQSSICIITFCKTMLIYPCTKICMYCCHDPTTQLNKLSPIKVWIPEKKFLNYPSETRKARKTHQGPCPGQSRTAFPLDTSATSVHSKDLSPASSNLPCFSKRTAKLLTELSVSGCWGPSWDSRPSKARRCSPSAHGSRWSTNKTLKHGGHRSRGGPQFLD